MVIILVLLVMENRYKIFIIISFILSITIKNKDKSSTTLHIGKDGKHTELHDPHNHHQGGKPISRSANIRRIFSG